MEKKINGLTVGYQEDVPFNLLEDDSGAHAPTFKLLRAQDNSSFVIVCQWVNPISCQYNDREEIFYIDGITNKTMKQAESIILKVYQLLNKAFYEKSNQRFTMQTIINDISNNYQTQSVVLKSVHPEEYPDLEVVCKVIPNDQIGAYLETIPEEDKIVAFKNKTVTASEGVEGEEIKTVLTTMIDGKEYVLHEETNTVKNRDGLLDVVVTNIHSTSNEKYIVKRTKFDSCYEFVPDRIFQRSGFSPRYMPKYDPRVLSKVSENVIIMTSWGEPAICLKGSYIVTYNAEENDYNTIEQDAFESTYSLDEKSKKRIK